MLVNRRDLLIPVEESTIVDLRPMYRYNNIWAFISWPGSFAGRSSASVGRNTVPVWVSASGGPIRVGVDRGYNPVFLVAGV